jgi:ABC-type polysaccharide/polyol phosphate export permease
MAALVAARPPTMTSGDNRTGSPPRLNPTAFRTGWRAALLDALLAMVAMGVAYVLRFDRAEVLHFLSAAWPALVAVVAVQLVLAALVGLYGHGGQKMWPVRLAAGLVAGAAIGGFGGGQLGLSTGLSRQALAIQVALTALSAMLWRTLVGFKVRQIHALEISRRFGGQDLVVQGADVGSMAGMLEQTWAYRHLLFNLVAKDLKLKYQRSVLGFSWSLLNPLIMTAVYTVAFTYILKVSTPRFVLYLLSGLLAWTFFAGAIAGATDAISGGAALLRSVVFPRVVLPFATVLFWLIQYLLTIVMFLPVMMVVYGVALEPRMLLFPVFVVLQVLCIAGLSLALSTAAASFRDVRHLVDVGLSILFWATPILYEMTMVPEELRQLALLGPMTPFVRAYQDIFYYGVVPDLAVWLVAIVYAIGAFVCGLSVFLAFEDEMPEMV